MRLLLTAVLSLLCLSAYSQSTITQGSPKTTLHNKGSQTIDSVLKLARYASADTNKVLGIDASGNVVLRTKGNTVGIIGIGDVNGLVAALESLASDSDLSDTATALRLADHYLGTPTFNTATRTLTLPVNGLTSRTVVIPDSVGSGGTWGSITGTLSSQADLSTALAGKQATLVSGTSIKTINGSSILGSGNIAISGGSGSPLPADIQQGGAATNDVIAWNGTEYAPASVVDVVDAAMSSATTTASRAGVTGSATPTGYYFYEEVNVVGGDKTFVSLNFYALGAGSITVAFFQNSGGNADIVYSKTVSIPGSGLQVLTASDLTIPDPTFASTPGPVFVGIRVLSGSSFPYQVVTAGQGLYGSFAADGDPLSTGNDLQLGYSVNYSTPASLADVFEAVSVLKPASTVEEILAALAPNAHIVIAPGSYELTATLSLPEGVWLQGSGQGNTTLTITGGDPYILEVGGVGVHISDLTIDGEDATLAKGLVSAADDVRTYVGMGTVQGIRAVTFGGLVVENVTVQNCNHSGIYFTGNHTGGYGGPAVKISKCHLANNYHNIFAGGQYSLISDCSSNYGASGVTIIAGNIIVSNSHFTDNAVNAALLPVGNDTHGGFTNCTFNHATIKGLYVKSTTLTETFSSCQFFDGDIELSDASGISFNNCVIAGSVDVDGGQGNRMTDCVFYPFYGAGTFNYTNGGKLKRKGNTYFNDADPSALNDAIPEYADNAAAVAGGLFAGDTYRTGDVLKIVH